MALIDICLEEREADLWPDAPGEIAPPVKIGEYAQRLRDGNYDKWEELVISLF
jgi:hypothetical protein